jgi:hypothetical protein
MTQPPINLPLDDQPSNLETPTIDLTESGVQASGDGISADASEDSTSD